MFIGAEIIVNMFIGENSICHEINICRIYTIMS